MTGLSRWSWLALAAQNGCCAITTGLSLGTDASAEARRRISVERCCAAGDSGMVERLLSAIRDFGSSSSSSIACRRFCACSGATSFRGKTTRKSVASTKASAVAKDSDLMVVRGGLRPRVSNASMNNSPRLPAGPKVSQLLFVKSRRELGFFRWVIEAARPRLSLSRAEFRHPAQQPETPAARDQRQSRSTPSRSGARTGG